MLNVLPAC